MIDHGNHNHRHRLIYLQQNKCRNFNEARFILENDLVDKGYKSGDDGGTSDNWIPLFSLE